MSDDPELLRLYTEEGSEDAFAELVGRHIDFVYATALRRSRSVQRAEDITQVTFTALARQSKALHRRAELVGWLYTTVCFTAAKVIRTEVRRQKHEQEARLMQEITSDPAPEADWRQLYPVLDEALSDLNKSDRSAILLRFFKNRTFAEIGASLRLTEDAARKRVSRALGQLQGSLSKRGISSTAAALAAVMASQASSAAPAGLAATVTGSALASAASASLPALSFLRIFGTVKMTAGIAGVMGILSVGVGFHQLQLAREEQASQAAAEYENKVQSDRLRTLNRSLASAERDRDKLSKAIRELRRQGAADGKALGNAAQNPRADGRKFLAEFPEARTILVARGKTEFAQLFAPFYRSAALPPDQIERFETALAKNNLGYLAITSPTNYLSTPDQLPEDQLREILGDQGYRHFQDYERIEYAHRLAWRVAAKVNYTPDPLSPGQADQLAQIVADNSTLDPSGQTNPDPDLIQWDAVAVQAKSMMSASQWKMAEGVLLSGQFGRALDEAQRAQGTSSGSAGALAP